MVDQKNELNFLKEAPQNIEAEQAILSAIIINNRAYEKVSEFLRVDDFSEKVHGTIYEACERLISKGHAVDPITLKSYFEQKGELDSVGGFEFLVQLSDAGVSAIHAADYGRIVHDKAMRRKLIEIGQDITHDAYTQSMETPAKAQIEIAEKKLFDLASVGEVEGGFEKLIDSLNISLKNTEEAFKADGNITGVSTGLKDLDDKTGGMHPSDLVIVAARPGMGKTVLALNLAFNAANEVSQDRAPSQLKGPVAFFSLEMSSDQLSARILSSQAEIGAHKMRTGTVTEDEFSKLTQYARALTDMPLYIDDTPGISVPAIRTRCRRLKRQHGGLAMIVIDYIQLLSSPGGMKQENRVQELSEMTRGLKLLAKEMQCPVIALSQLNRSVEQRQDKKPLLSDLRESGSIEQDADMVMFIYREAYYLQQSQPDNMASEEYVKWDTRMNQIRNKAELLIAKQRHGPAGTVPLAFIGEYSKFGDYYEG